MMHYDDLDSYYDTVMSNVYEYRYIKKSAEILLDYE
jgi:hypothetical protein